MTKGVEKIGNATLYCGDANDILSDLEQIDSCVTDPPYGLSFMGKAWDYDVPGVDIWTKVHNVLRPGAHLLSFRSSRSSGDKNQFFWPGTYIVSLTWAHSCCMFTP